MTISTLVLNIGIVAAIFTAIVGLLLKRQKSYLMTFLQSFCGILFIFSGWVKAIDPMGTAFKMEQYFGEFEATFSQTMFSFLSPVFPALASVSILFSVTMIVFEIVLGIMLLLGYKPKLSAWLFFGLVAFFTVLTGFTFLTGYVPAGINFFDFGHWGAYKASNMKVTDCGCFGDFIKLEPRISFFKDIALLLPSMYFLLRYKTMHELISMRKSGIIVGVSTVLLIAYCLYNFVLDEPHIDFRPFKNGADIAAQRVMEEKAQAEVQVKAFAIKDLASGNILEVPYAQYMADVEKYADKTKWEVVDQIKTTPSLPITKISEFEITDFDGVDFTDMFLSNPKNHFMVISPKVKFSTASKQVMVQDSIFAMDTVGLSKDNQPIVEKKFLKAINKEMSKTDFIWPASFVSDLVSMREVLDKAKAAGSDVSVVVGGISADAAKDLAEETGISATYLTADDILLKTIIRSNPGLVLWKNGKLVQKWHKKKLPPFDEISVKYLK
ncbi:MAG: DoxX family protein [Saprospiraceae bacterium]|nr:DoxX family protein [Saprospiraceae bacterium]